MTHKAPIRKKWQITGQQTFFDIWRVEIYHSHTEGQKSNHIRAHENERGYCIEDTWT